MIFHVIALEETNICKGDLRLIYTLLREGYK